jgi:hypothetical protein
MDCTNIRDALLTGSVPTGAEVDAHVRDCVACGELLRDESLLGRAFPGSRRVTPDTEDQWESLEVALGSERGARAWLRSRSTSFRLVAAALVVLALVSLGGWLPEAGVTARSTAWAATFVVASIAALGFLVTPFGYPARTLGARVAFTAVTLLLPLTRALTSSHDGALHFHAESSFAQLSLACFSYGLLLVSPFVVVLWWLDRSERSVMETLAGVGTAAGLVANAGLALHCPSADPAHLALGHATIGAALAGLGVTFRMFTAAAHGSAKARTKSLPRR